MKVQWVRAFGADIAHAVPRGISDMTLCGEDSFYMAADHMPSMRHKCSECLDEIACLAEAAEVAKSDQPLDFVPGTRSYRRRAAEDKLDEGDV